MVFSTDYYYQISADEGSEHSHIAKHSAVNILRKIGFSTNLLSEATLEKIKQKSAEQDEKSQKENKTVDFAELSGTGAVVLNKIRYQERRRDLICRLAKEGNVLSMRKDINIRKELRIPSQRVSRFSLISYLGHAWTVLVKNKCKRLDTQEQAEQPAKKS